jgi:hypothetical protein
MYYIPLVGPVGHNRAYYRVQYVDGFGWVEIFNNTSFVKFY